LIDGLLYVYETQTRTAIWPLRWNETDQVWEDSDGVAVDTNEQIPTFLPRLNAFYLISK